MSPRKATPTALRILRGNPHKKPINHREPTPGPLEPACPSVIRDPEARAEWQRLIPDLIACGIATAADRAVLVGYCVAWARWLALDAVAARKRDRGPQEAAHKAFTQMLRAAVECGLTPAARTRIHVQPAGAAPGSQWADVLP